LQENPGAQGSPVRATVFTRARRDASARKAAALDNERGTGHNEDVAAVAEPAAAAVEFAFAAAGAAAEAAGAKAAAPAAAEAAGDAEARRAAAGDVDTRTMSARAAQTAAAALTALNKG